MGRYTGDRMWMDRRRYYRRQYHLAHHARTRSLRARGSHGSFQSHKAVFGIPLERSFDSWPLRKLCYHERANVRRTRGGADDCSLRLSLKYENSFRDVGIEGKRETSSRNAICEISGIIIEIERQLPGRGPGLHRWIKINGNAG